MNYLLNYKLWESRIFEQESDSMSNLNAYSIFAGATVSKTSNKSALDAYKEANPSTKIQGEETMDDTKALKKSGATWSVVDKSVKSKDYLKIGDKILDGSSGKPTTIKISARALQKEEIEASGNGIFALGRAIKTVREAAVAEKSKGGNPGDVWQSADVVIGLNLKSANSFYANASTGFQNAKGNFTTGMTFTMIPTGAVVPSAQNTTNHVSVARKLEYSDKVGVNGKALPYISDQKKWSPILTEVNVIDSSIWVNKYKDKGISKWDDSAKAAVNDYVNTFFASHINTTADRYKAFLNKIAEESGISSDMFSEMFSRIDSWKKAELGKKSEYLNAANGVASAWFESKSDRGGTTRPVMTGSGKVVTGQEGKL